MTRFLLTLDRAVETVFAAVEGARAGETYVPRVPRRASSTWPTTLIDGRDIASTSPASAPARRSHEIMVSEEECHRTIERGDYYVILPMLPELRRRRRRTPALTSEYSSSDGQPRRRS